MEELVNIGNFCSGLKIKYGKKIKDCDAVYLEKEDIIEFSIRYWIGENLDYFIYVIQNCNFIITDVDVFMNKFSADTINNEVNNRLKNNS